MSFTTLSNISKVDMLFSDNTVGKYATVDTKLFYSTVFINTSVYDTIIFDGYVKSVGSTPTFTQVAKVSDKYIYHSVNPTGAVGALPQLRRSVFNRVSTQSSGTIATPVAIETTYLATLGITVPASNSIGQSTGVWGEEMLFIINCGVVGVDIDVRIWGIHQ